MTHTLPAGPCWCLSGIFHPPPPHIARYLHMNNWFATLVSTWQFEQDLNEFVATYTHPNRPHKMWNYNVNQQATAPQDTGYTNGLQRLGGLLVQGKVPDLLDTTGGALGRDPTPKGGGGGPPPLYGPQNCRTEQCALSAPEAPEILF